MQLTHFFWKINTTSTTHNLQLPKNVFDSTHLFPLLCYSSKCFLLLDNIKCHVDRPGNCFEEAADAAAYLAALVTNELLPISLPIVGVGSESKSLVPLFFFNPLAQSMYTCSA